MSISGLKVGIIGAGNMGSAIACSLISNIDFNDLIIFDLDESKTTGREMELFRGNDTQQTEGRINTIFPSAWNNHSQVSYKGYRAVRERIFCKGGGAYRIADYISQKESEVDVMKNVLNVE